MLDVCHKTADKKRTPHTEYVHERVSIMMLLPKSFEKIKTQKCNSLKNESIIHKGQNVIKHEIQVMKVIV